MATFVLIHGSWHGSWAWSLLRPLLTMAGHDVVTPTLPGCAERFDALDHSITLSDHVVEVADLLEYEDLHDVVLVGHSYGATLLEGVVNRQAHRIRGIVALDGTMIDPGGRSRDLWTAEQSEAADRAVAAGSPFREPVEPETLGIPEGPQRRWVAARLTPHPLGCYTDRLPPPGREGAHLPRTFIQCTEGPMAELFTWHARRARALGWSTTEFAAPHDAMLTHPVELAGLLSHLVGDSAGAATEHAH